LRRFAVIVILADTVAVCIQLLARVDASIVVTDTLADLIEALARTTENIGALAEASVKIGDHNINRARDIRANTLAIIIEELSSLTMVNGANTAASVFILNLSFRANDINTDTSTCLSVKDLVDTGASESGIADTGTVLVESTGDPSVGAGPWQAFAFASLSVLLLSSWARIPRASAKAVTDGALLTSWALDSAETTARCKVESVILRAGTCRVVGASALAGIVIEYLRAGASVRGDIADTLASGGVESLKTRLALLDTGANTTGALASASGSIPVVSIIGITAAGAVRITDATARRGGLEDLTGTTPSVGWALAEAITLGIANLTGWASREIWAFALARVTVDLMWCGA